MIISNLTDEEYLKKIQRVISDRDPSAIYDVAEELAERLHAADDSDAGYIIKLEIENIDLKQRIKDIEKNINNLRTSERDNGLDGILE